MYEYYSTTGTGVAPAYYAYDTQNRRVWQWNGSTYASPYSTTPNSYTVYFYGVNGKRLAAYTLTAGVVWQGNKVQSLTMSSAVLTQDAYFGGRRLAGLDRVGSTTQVGSQNVSFYPYGEDKGTPGANDNWKFGTYLRDSATGLDYAMNRYYSSGSGRFMSPDPYRASGGPAVPQSWNRYAFVEDDPANFGDPSGLDLTAEQCIENVQLCDGSTGSFGFGSGAPGSGPDLGLPPPGPSLWNLFAFLQSSGSLSPPQTNTTSSVGCYNRSCLPAALKLALEALALPSCQKLFGTSQTRSNGFNPSTVLSSLAAGGNQYGSINFSFIPLTVDAITTEVLPGLPLANSPKPVVIINSLYIPGTSLWNNGDALNNAITLLHELGHVFNLLSGSGGSMIKTDSIFYGSSANETTVINNCFVI
jgi:RHS repeat-associated protein